MLLTIGKSRCLRPLLLLVGFAQPGPFVDHVRGCGLLRGVVLTAPAAKAVQAAARHAGFLVNAAAAEVIRLAPPLVITEAQIDEFLTALPDVLNTAAV